MMAQKNHKNKTPIAHHLPKNVIDFELLWRCILSKIFKVLTKKDGPTCIIDDDSDEDDNTEDTTTVPVPMATTAAQWQRKQSTINNQQHHHHDPHYHIFKI